MSDLHITQVNIPCPHCEAIRVCRPTDPTWIGDAICESCGAFVPGQDWRQSWTDFAMAIFARIDARVRAESERQRRTPEERAVLLQRIRERQRGEGN